MMPRTFEEAHRCFGPVARSRFERLSHGKDPETFTDGGDKHGPDTETEISRRTTSELPELVTSRAFSHTINMRPNASVLCCGTTATTLQLGRPMILYLHIAFITLEASHLYEFCYFVWRDIAFGGQFVLWSPYSH